MSASQILLGIQASQTWLADLAKQENRGLKEKVALAGDDTDRVSELNGRKAALTETMRLLTLSVESWDNARQHVPVKGRGNESAALRLGVESLLQFLEACDAYDPDLVLPPVAQALVSQLPDDGSTGSHPAPVSASGPASPPPPAPDTDDSSSEKEPKSSPAPAPAVPDSGTPSWVKDLQDTMTGALEANAETVRVHVEGCNATLEEFREALEELKRGGVNSDLVTVINRYTEDGLIVALEGGVKANLIAQQLDDIDLDLLRKVLDVFSSGNFTVDDLVAALKIGRTKRAVSGWVDNRRWTRKSSNTSPTPGSHT